MLLARFNPQREDYLRQTEELFHFAQLNDSSIQLENKPSVATVKTTGMGRYKNNSERQRKKQGATLSVARKVTISAIARARPQKTLRWLLCKELMPPAIGYCTVGQVVTW